MKIAALIFSGTVMLSCGGAFAQSQDLAGSTAGATIETRSWDQNFTFSDGPRFDPSSSDFLLEKSQKIQFGAGGRWQMNIESLTRAEESPLPREEMRAGATYRFTPRFSLGGSVSLGADELDDVSQWKEQSVEAGVQLKTTLKF